MRILILTENGFEDSELLCPKYRFMEEGYQVDIAALNWGEVKGKHGYVVTANLELDDIEPESFNALFIPGGKAPEKLAFHEKVLDLVREFDKHSLPIFAICHGPLLLAKAGLLKGKKATCYYKVAEKLIELGAIYEDSPVVIHENIITSRQPGDLPQFMKAVLAALKNIS